MIHTGTTTHQHAPVIPVSESSSDFGLPCTRSIESSKHFRLPSFVHGHSLVTGLQVFPNTLLSTLFRDRDSLLVESDRC